MNGIGNIRSFIVMSNATTEETKETNASQICPSIAYIVWEDYGCVNIHRTPEGELIIAWQVTGMPESETVNCASFEEALNKSLSIIDGTPDQVLVAVADDEDTFVDIPLTTEDTDEIVEEVLKARALTIHDKTPSWISRAALSIKSLFSKVKVEEASETPSENSAEEIQAAPSEEVQEAEAQEKQSEQQ